MIPATPGCDSVSLCSRDAPAVARRELVHSPELRVDQTPNRVDASLARLCGDARPRSLRILGCKPDERLRPSLEIGAPSPVELIGPRSRREGHQQPRLGGQLPLRAAPRLEKARIVRDHVATAAGLEVEHELLDLRPGDDRPLRPLLRVGEVTD